MRPQIREFVQRVNDAVSLPQPIVEFGSYRCHNQETLADLRPLFPGVEYIGCDVRPGMGVDEIRDAEHSGFRSGSVGTVLLLEMLEHAKRPQQVCAGAYDILRSGGFLLASSHFLFPVHDEPIDYWRFTPAAFDLLLEQFESRLIIPVGSPYHTPVAIACKGTYDFGPLNAALAPWVRQWEKQS